ncbi:sialidase family protein [Roseimaritima ulvae]|uniref:BNR/Asp-box repeat protein n=1 Tax=Roseimaritima ulvae TaxID=980254 RepID=A0A5B9QVR8_9BACT|nr:sialidase family protein [Roseimaritima ulvae]QEG42062.1 BNR/Asp-box repeat protein [Roseimaritima ulvae]
MFLSANELSIATGQPSLVRMSSVSTHIPVWSLSGGTPGQSVSGVAPGFPHDYEAVKVEIVVTSTDKATSSEFTDAYRVHLSQLVDDEPFTSRYQLGKPAQTALPAGPLHTRTILLESYYEIVPDAPLMVRIQREPALPQDTFTRPTGLVGVKVTALKAPDQAHVVQNVRGYNSWPMIQAIGKTLVCTYSRGTKHTISEDARAVYARTSTDGGKTWTAETTVADTPGYGEVTVGKGLDSDGAMLLWVRRVGKGKAHDLYRSEDGIHFSLLATPELDVQPMQITDVFHVPEVGLMCLWFAGNYRQDTSHQWGLMTSDDNGLSWTQRTIESDLTHADWPTEPAAVYLGEGRILGIARTESGSSQFQIVSTDAGQTWTRSRTNISDIKASTPSLIYDPETGLLSNYYYERGRGILRRRVVDADFIFARPQSWPGSQAVAIGSTITFDAGNANATAIGDTHYISFYSGEAPDTSVLVSPNPAPQVSK